MGTVIVRPTGTMVREDPHRLVDAYSIFVEGREKGHDLMKRDAVRLATAMAAERHAHLVVERPHGRVQSSYGNRRHGDVRLITSEQSSKAERAVRSAAVAKFGRVRKDVFYEHGQWWVRLIGRDEDETYSAVDTNRGIDFERL